MNVKMKTLAMLLIFISIGSFFLAQLYLNKDKTRQGASIEERQQFKRDLAAIDAYHDYLDKGDDYARNGEITNAEKEYCKALEMAKNPDGEVIARGKLARFYESIGRNEKALEEVEWFLKRNLAEPGRIRYSQAKERLLRKIQENQANSPQERDTL